MRKWFILGSVVVLFAVAGIGASVLRNQLATSTLPPIVNKTVHSLHMLSGDKYPLNSETALRFSIEDQNSKVLKDFDTSQDQILHLTIVRKDRTNFQHLHPVLDKVNGSFTKPVLFPGNGDYRIYATFATSEDSRNVKSETVYKDVQVGDLSNYVPPQALEINKTAAVSNGYIAGFFFPPNDDSVGPTNTSYYAGQDSSIAISINKNGHAYTNFETYDGSLGRLAILGPDLQLTTVDSTALGNSEQSGLLTFSVVFPKSGLYKLFLQTEAENQLTTFDFALKVKNAPSSTQN